MMPSAATADALPAVCEVRDWVVFGPGLHKGTLYTPEMCARVPQNFAALVEYLTPSGKLGHDRQQRLAKSLGFLNVGKVTAVKPVGGGNFALTVKDIPTAVGAEINAGRLNSGSVELLPKLPDPKDPARDIPGPILTGVAFLGEEQPAVKGFDPPRAVFADGTPVPPSKDPAPWFNALAEVLAFAAAAGGLEDSAPRFSWLGREYSATVISFSEMQMDPKAQLAALGLTPEQIEKALAICGGVQTASDPAAGAATGAVAQPTPMGDSANPLESLAKFADDPKATNEQKMFGSLAKAFSASLKQFSDDLADVKKRTGAVEKMSEDAQKKDEEQQMAAFSAHCEPRLVKIARKVAPVLIESAIKPALNDIAKSKTFSAGTDRYKAADELLSRYEAMPDDPRLAKAAGPVTAPAPTAATNPIIAAMTAKGSILDRANPEMAKQYRQGAAA